MAIAIESYRDALRTIRRYPHYTPDDTGSWSLARLGELMARLGNPEKRFFSLLIAGTKGKGSTAAISERILRSAHYKTGLYTSPYLHSFRESIRLRGEPISERDFIETLQRLLPYFEATDGLTAFELTTALAIVTFAQAEIDVAVFEVGLGGRLDATNIVDPTVAVITSISYDHMKVLGDTLTQIAWEKAGIIRDEALVISAPQVDEARQVIEQVCKDRRAKLVLIDRDRPWHIDSNDLEGQMFTVYGKQYYLPLLGRHQVTNAVTALSAVRGLEARAGLDIANEAIREGLASVEWPGRMELMQQKPFVLLDGAMNGDSAEKLVDALAYYFDNRPVMFIFGASHDHAIKDMLKTLLPVAAHMVVTASSHRRAESPENLAAAASSLGYSVETVPDPALALKEALIEASEETVICVTGSLFLVAEVREAWLQNTGQRLPTIDPKDLY